MRIIPAGRILTALVYGIVCASSVHAQVRSNARAADCVDINTAALSQLERIIHIGAARAAEIITLREQRSFRTVNDLARVNGIGAARLRDIKEQGLACVKTSADSDSARVDAAAGPVRNVPPVTERQATSACIDLNTASETELQRITQIGQARARQIVALRALRRFETVDDLVRVDGIAAGRLAQIKAQGLACVNRSTADSPSHSVDALRFTPVAAGARAASEYICHSVAHPVQYRWAPRAPASANTRFTLRRALRASPRPLFTNLCTRRARTTSSARSSLSLAARLRWSS
jgi:competence ComEA-like helix-hairpin-helix protein